MCEASKQRPIISLRAVGGSVRTNKNGTGTFLDVTFKCAFTQEEEGLSGSAISIGREEMFSVAQLAETAYFTIGKLLAKQRRAEQVDE